METLKAIIELIVKTTILLIIENLEWGVLLLLCAIVITTALIFN